MITGPRRQEKTMIISRQGRRHASHGWQPDRRREPASMGGTAR
jgi:hypothetical protein